jgi:hypothetical protein
MDESSASCGRIVTGTTCVAESPWTFVQVAVPGKTVVCTIGPWTSVSARFGSKSRLKTCWRTGCSG